MKKIMFTIMILITIIQSGCAKKVPVSRTLFEPMGVNTQQVFSDDLGLCVTVNKDYEIFTRHPSGFVGSGIPFQFELGNVLRGVTRDAVASVFNDVYPLCAESSKENIHKILDIHFTGNDLLFELSYASNKFDRAKYIGRADIVLYVNGDIKYTNNRHLLGEFVNTGVGGDTATFERAFSTAILGMIDDLVRDEQFASNFSRISQPSDVASRLDQLEELKTKGKITEEEYRQSRQRILGGI